MTADVMTVRVDKQTRAGVETLSHKRHESQSEIVRRAIMEFVESQKQNDEIKEMVSLKFAQGKISFNELVRILGYDEAKEVLLFVEQTTIALKEGLKR